jgi:hypothetical protein
MVLDYSRSENTMTADERKQIGKLLQPALDYAKEMGQHAQITVELKDPSTGQKTASYTVFDPPIEPTPELLEVMRTHKGRRETTEVPTYKATRKEAQA